MRRSLTPLFLLMLLGVGLLAPLVVGCASAPGVVADPAPLPPEADDEEGQGGG